MFCYAGQAKEGNNGSDEQTLQYPRENWCIVIDLFCEELMSHTC
jgi:hypothetical protein